MGAASPVRWWKKEEFNVLQQFSLNLVVQVTNASQISWLVMRSGFTSFKCHKRGKTKPTHLVSGKVHLHHDNASSHTAVKTRQFLEESKLQLTDHPPHSPDLASCDFWLFRMLSQKLAGINFQREQNLTRKINAELKTIPGCQYCECFVKWMTQLQKYANLQGKYVEGVWVSINIYL